MQVNVKQSLCDLSPPRASKITERASEGCTLFTLVWQEVLDFTLMYFTQIPGIEVNSQNLNSLDCR